MSLAGILRISYIKNTILIPAPGGVLKEIIIGKPYSLNPLLAYLYDADKDLIELLFSGLLKYDGMGNLKEDLAKKYEILDEGKSYLFTLKDNLYWSDGKPILADDVIFTLETMLSPKVQTPIALPFEKIKVEKIDQKRIKFILPEPYFPFIENFTFKILPKHIFEKKNIEEVIAPFFEKEIAFSGPFIIEKIKKANGEIEEIILRKNEFYHLKKPWIEKMNLRFVQNPKEALRLQNWAHSIAIKEISFLNEKIGKRFEISSLFLPRYFALFLNQKNQIPKEVREALAYATPKEKIIKEVLKKRGRKMESLFLPEHKIEGDFKKYQFDLEKAKKILEDNGWKMGKDNLREKEVEGKKKKLKLNFFVPEQPILKRTSKILKENWEEIGIKINLKIVEPQKLLKENIEKRNYDILLFGLALSLIPDPFVFWHSTQIQFPGQNLSLYQNEKLDKLLKETRTEMDLKKRKENLAQIQAIIAEDIPAIFLFSPDYIYLVNKKIKGRKTKFINEPSGRFADISDWYLKQKRVKKIE